ncbi:uncharacterized protein LOC764345 isoform X2 [Strongylocentrotus purpuratus]|uniref:TIR domain-containing protein n=1 Tax=Strongylocentrotus purpuratus TaxID=7668 RepID=A0A7M7T0M6_STRPU|nr:uncharacterized protein LOC764345 isoform X2 [Strongylocentrotus purpuratus]
MSVPIRETIAPAPTMIRSRSTLPKRITETVQFIRPAGSGYRPGYHETVVNPQPAGLPYPETYPQPFRSPRERPADYLPLDRIHEDGHPDIARFTTDEFKEFHEYLTKSTENGRSFQGSGQIDLEDIANIQTKTLEGLKTPSSEANQGALLDTLLSLCELSNLRDKKCVDFFTEAGFNDIFRDIWLELHGNDQINHPGLYIGLNLLIDASQRFTENSPELSRQMGKNKVVLMILDKLRDPFFDVEALNRDDEELKWMSRRELLKKMFTLLYNCIRNHPDNRRFFRMIEASELLKPFLDCRFYILRAKALFILAYIVTEEENIDLNTTSLNIEFIVKVLRRALEDPSHYSAHYNFFAVEVVEAVQRVAANDHNKDKFIEAGVLPHLVTMMDETNSKEERNSALNALWVLSFTANNKDVILNEKGCIDNVRACIGVDDYTRTCQAILWNLQDQVITRPEAKKEEDKDDKPEEKGGDGNRSNNGLTSPETGNPEVDRKITPKLPHVMISYQWDVQKQILKVKDVLKALGYNVWLDVERMGGSTLEAMANAVEEACVVIICFSEKYKDSPACRTDDTMRIYEHRPMVQSPPPQRIVTEVPVIVEKIVAVPAPAPTVPKTEGTTCVQIVQQWDSGEVINWLRRNNYSHLQNWFLSYNGEDLMGLKRIAAQAPEFFFGKLEREFGFKSLLEMIRFKNMLDAII